MDNRLTMESLSSGNVNMRHNYAFFSLICASITPLRSAGECG